MVMTATSELLDELEDAFGAATTREFADPDAGLRVAQSKMDVANALSVRGAAFEDAKRAARLYGQCAAIGSGNDSTELESDAKSRFAQLMASVVVPNRDEARARSSELFRKLGDDQRGWGDHSHAAMSWTNSAVAILEMRNPTSEQLDAAYSLLEETLRLRAKGTVDAGYGQINLAIAGLKIAHRLPADQRRVKYSQLLKDFDRGARTLDKFEGSHCGSTYHNNVVETLTNWLEFELGESEEQLYTECLSADLDDSDSPLSRSQIVRMLVRNPGVLDLPETPEWVPTNTEIISHALARVPPLDRRLENAEAFLENDEPRPNHELRMRIFKLKSMLTELRGLPDPPFESFNSDWNAGSYEDYLVNALTFLTWTGAASYAEDQYVILVRRVIKCVLMIRASWSARDTERLFSRQPLAFRFAACELGRLGLWQDGFLLLEATRGIISSRSFGELSLDSDETDPVCQDVTWVHISNSPRAAYVFVFQDGRYFGKEFIGLGGRELSAEFVNLTRGGLLVSQDDDRSVATDSAQRISRLLQPIADWVDAQCADRVVLSLGGFFQSFPIWACGRLGESWLTGRRLISTAPSRAIAIRSAIGRATPMTLRALTVHEASALPGQSALEWSEHEPDVIRHITQSYLTVSTETATRSGLVASLETADAVHFTGHSSAEFDPLESSLITYGEPLTVRDILDAAVSSSLVVLASCQSALARNVQRQDEMLSVQTAMFYSGAGCVVGTTWPITDSAGFIFTVNFYEFLAQARQADAVSVEAVIRASTAALSWMRGASIADVNVVCDRYGAPNVSGDPQDRAFGFYEWAAVGVVGLLLGASRAQDVVEDLGAA